MAIIPSTPQNVLIQTANQTNLISWNLVTGAVAYQVQRSLDNVNFTTIANPTSTRYLDTNISLGVQYWYQVAAASLVPTNAVSTVTFTGQPTASQVLMVGNISFTAVASGATGNQFNIGSSVAATITNLAGVINVALVNVVIATTSSTVLTLTAFNSGTSGNAIETSSTLSNSTLVGFTGGITGTFSPYGIPGNGNQTSVIAAPVSEMALGMLRFAVMQKADRVNSNFVTVPEYTTYINLAMKELYDLLITTFEDYFLAPRIQFLTVANNQSQSLYPLPNGSNNFIDSATQQTVIPQAFYKLRGVDLGLNNANNSFVTINKYNFIDRNRYIYPNTASTIYSAFNLKYRVMGTNIEFIPSPQPNQLIQLCYIPRLPDLLQDTDITTIGFSGWLEYVIVRAAKYVLDKEESDTTKLDMELMAINKRIEESASNRDAGEPDKISDTRANSHWGGDSGFGWNGSIGGF